MPLVHLNNPAFVYYIPAKTASTSLVSALCSQFPAAEVLYDKHGIFVPPELLRLQDKKIFMTVRNPYARVVSAWNFFSHNLSFSDFVRSVGFTRYRNKLWHALPCSWWDDAVPLAKEYLRTEYLLEDLNKLQLGNHTFKTLPVLRTSDEVYRVRRYKDENKPWPEVYAIADISVVAKLYAEDFRRYGYPVDWEENVKMFTRENNSR